MARSRHQQSPLDDSNQQGASRDDLLAEIARLRQHVDLLTCELEHSAHARADETRQLYAILSALPTLIFLMSADGRYLKVFTGESTLLAIPPSRMLGKTVHELLPPDRARYFQSVLDETLRTRQAQTLDYEFQIENGETRWFAATIVPVCFEHSQCVMWVASDVTERKLAEQEIQRARDAAVASNRLKSQFLANMSHEIRTPLNGVIGMTRLLAETERDGRKKQWIHNIETCAQSLLSVISDILDFSRIEAGGITIRAQAFDLAAAVREVVALFRDQDSDRPVRFTCTIDPALPPVLIGDPDRIRQVLMNLLGNAVKFTREGEISVQLVCTPQDHDMVRVRIDIADTGIGIDAPALERIFEPFVQVDGSAARDHGGTGLGLSIVKHLVELMSGDIRVTSTPGAGSTFSLTIGLQRVDTADGATDASTGIPRASDPDMEPEQAPQPRARAEAGTSAGRARVLLVEDNAVGQIIGHHLLAGLGYASDAVSNGEQAIAAVARGIYDLVLMDCRMPVLDGYEATRRIRAAEPPGTRIPIIALTAHAMQGDHEECLAAGMDDYLTKPLAAADLDILLRKWIRRRDPG